jgi:hypothetical protein
MNLPSLFTRQQTHKKRTRPSPRRLTIEGLEDRRMCALPGIHYDAAGVISVLRVFRRLGAWKS